MAGNVELVISSKDKQAIASFNKLISKASALGTEFNKSSSNASKKYKKEWKDAHENAFGKGAKAVVGDFSKMFLAGGAFFMAMNGAKRLIGSVTQAMRENKQAVDENLQGLLKYSQLNTLSRKDRETLFSVAGRVPINEASSIGFTAKSAGFTDLQLRNLFKQVNFAQGLGEQPSPIGSSIVGLKQSVFGDKSLERISDFLGVAAEQSPLGAAEFAPQFTKVGGVAGLSDREKAAGAAILSAITKAQAQVSPTGDIDANLAATATKNFLIRRKTSAAGLLDSLGLGGASAPEQLQGLAQAFRSGKVGTKELTTAFSQRTAPALQTLFSSQEALSGIAPDQKRILGALTSTGPSLFQRKYETLLENDPQAAAVLARKEEENRIEIDKTRRGFEQAGIDLALTRFNRRAKDQGFGSVTIGVLTRPQLIGDLADDLLENVPDELFNRSRFDLARTGLSLISRKENQRRLRELSEFSEKAGRFATNRPAADPSFEGLLRAQFDTEPISRTQEDGTISTIQPPSIEEQARERFSLVDEKLIKAIVEQTNEIKDGNELTKLLLAAIRQQNQRAKTGSKPGGAR